MLMATIIFTGKLVLASGHLRVIFVYKIHHKMISVSYCTAHILLLLIILIHLLPF